VLSTHKKGHLLKRIENVPPLQARENINKNLRVKLRLVNRNGTHRPPRGHRTLPRKGNQATVSVTQCILASGHGGDREKLIATTANGRVPEFERKNSVLRRREAEITNSPYADHSQESNSDGAPREKGTWPKQKPGNRRSKPRNIS